LTVVTAERTTIKCEYEMNQNFGDRYSCVVKEFPVILNRLDEDVLVSGTHMDGKTNDDVLGFTIFYASSVHMQHFPRGLHKAFKNLERLDLSYTGLKEIHLEDLAGFSKLEELGLQGNKIENLEENLFIGNRKLKWMSIESNQLKFIHPTAFNNLNELELLLLEKNPCVNGEAKYDIEEVKELITKAVENCTNV
jgi:Leucine-rich repeat (LRR) protein